MQPSRFAVQLTFHWGDAAQTSVAFLSPRRVVVGASPKADIVLPPAAVGDSHVLLDDELGGWVLRLPPRATLRTFGGPAGELRFGGDGERCIDLSERCRLRVSLGDFAFEVHASDMHGHVIPATPTDWRSLRWLGLSFAVHVFFVVNMLLTPPFATAIATSSSERLARYVEAHTEGLEPPPEPPMPAVPNGSIEGGGEPAPAESGTVGTEQGDPDRGGGNRVRGPDKTPRVPLTRENIAQMVTIQALRQASEVAQTISSPFGADDARGWSEDEVYGPLAELLGVGRGSRGLDMIGTGRGGGCSRSRGADCVAGTIGRGGPLDTIGFAPNGCSAEDFVDLVRRLGRARAIDRCSGHGPGHGDPPVKAPRVSIPPRIEEIDTWPGGLTKDQIRRVVHRNLPQVRHCYEQELLSHPDLAGRVTVRFVIQTSGAVLTSALAGSNIGNGDMESCVLQAVRRWPFPASDGMSIVTYPFMFQSAN